MFEGVIRPLRSRRAAIALIPVLLAGCGDRVKGVADPPVFGDCADLVAAVNVTPVVFRAGETIRIEVGVRNPTTRPIIMGFTSGCRLSYLVKNSSDIVVGPGFVCPLNAPTDEIAPGKTLAAQFSWDGTTASGTPLSPGEYQVSSDGFLCPSATPVTIRILAP